MTDFELKILDDIKIETFMKSIVQETSKWDFKNADYIRLVNALLDLSLNKPLPDFSAAKNIERGERIKINLPLEGNQVKIRLFNKETDYDIVQSWLEDEIGRWFLLSKSYSKATSLNDLIEDERNILGLITLSDLTPIGMMSYLDFDEFHHKAEMRKLIGNEDYREKGFAKEATRLWIQYGINKLGLKKIYLNTIENNIRNVTLNKELGFQIEGILRKECLIDNKYYDLLRMALIVD